MKTAEETVGKLELGEFAISIDDGFCEWTYRLKISGGNSTCDIVQRISEVYNCSMPEGVRRRDARPRHLKSWSKRFWQWVRFGTITERVTDRIDMLPCEIEYIGRGGKRVGYWAYGSFDPNYPYQG